MPHGKLSSSYDHVADEYVRRIYGELEKKPIDRELLDRFAEDLKDAKSVCDLGCGPGHVSRYLHERGAAIHGIDLSPGMVDQARQLNPDIEFRVGDMRSLNVGDGSWDGIVAFYSLIHISREEMPGVLLELRRTLRPNGLLFCAFHRGSETIHLDEWWGREVSLDFFFYERAEMEQLLHFAGFLVETVVERPPYPEVEHPSTRVYIRARKSNL